jgi:hypothetical protein
MTLLPSVGQDNSIVASAPGTVLHEYKITVFRWLIPLFFVLGCLLMSVGIGLPVLLRLPSDPGLWIAAGLAFLGGLAMPIGAVLLFLLIPQITTTLDAQRRVVVMDFRRPFGHSVKEYPVGDIADIRTVDMGENAYSLAMVLKSGKTIRLEYRSTSNTAQLQQQAGKIKALLAAHLP